jgi:hypothetical protein
MAPKPGHNIRNRQQLRASSNINCITKQSAALGRALTPVGLALPIHARFSWSVLRPRTKEEPRG